MTTFKWASGVSGDWDTAEDWTPGMVPGSADRALIEATGNYGVTIDAAEAIDSLTINASGAILTDTGTLTVGGDLKVLSGTFELLADSTHTGVVQGGTLSTQGGGAFDWKGGVLDAVTYRGTMTLAAGQSLTVQTSFAISSLTGGQGLIDMSAGASTFYAALAPNFPIFPDIDHVTFRLGSGAVITAGFYTSTKFVPEGQEFGSSSIIDVVGQDAYLNTSQSYLGMGDSGSIILEPDSSLIIGGTYYNQFRISGLTTVKQGATLYAGDPSLSQTDNFNNFHNGNLRSGTFDIEAGGTLRFSCGSVSSQQHFVLLTTTLTLGGPGAVVESFSDKDDSTLTMEQTLARISAAGDLELLGGRGYAGATTLLNQGTFDLAGGVFAEASLTNSGTVEGFGTIAAPVSNNQTLTASGGVLDVTDAVSGTGRFVIQAGAELKFDAAASAATATFAGAGGTLAMADPDSLTGKIAGFAVGDTIDLLGIAATSAARTPGTDTLVVKDNGTTVATLQLTGVYTHDTFAVASDGHGGSDITLMVPPTQLAQAMAAMPARTSAGPAHQTDVPPRLAMIAASRA